MTRHIPTVASRRLTSELRRLREQSPENWTTEQVAEVLGWSPSKVYRIEHDRVRVLVRDVRRLLDLYGAGDDEREVLLTLAKQAREKQGWWHRYDDVLPQWFEVYGGLEADAASLRTYQSELVHGLLQTEDYARALMRAVPRPEPDEEIERRIAMRLARQDRLTCERPLDYWAILNEAALRRRVGGRGMMRLQLDHLREMAELPNVTLQVLPFDAGAHPGVHGQFVILSFPEPQDPDVGYIEHWTGSLYLEKPSDIATYTEIFEHLRARALGPDESKELIHQASKEP